MTITLRLFCAFIFGLVLLSPDLNAQSAWLPPTDGSSVSVEVYRLDRPSTLNNFNGTIIFLSARLRKSSGLTYVIEVPAVRSDKRFSPVSPTPQKAQTAVGNPYLGISFAKNQSSSFTLDAGIRLPLAPNGKPTARVVGLESDFDRWEAFGPDLFSMRVLFGGKWSGSTSPLITKWIKVGGTVIGPTNNQDSDLLIDFQAGLRFIEDNLNFNTAIIGRTLLTQSGLSFMERSEFILGFDASLTFGSIRPGLHIRVPLTDNGLFDLGRRLSSVIGANLTYLFGGNNRAK